MINLISLTLKFSRVSWLGEARFGSTIFWGKGCKDASEMGGQERTATFDSGVCCDKRAKLICSCTAVWRRCLRPP